MNNRLLLINDRVRLAVTGRKRFVGGVVHHASRHLQRRQASDRDFLKAELGTVCTNPNGYHVFGAAVAPVAHQHPYISVFNHA